MITNKSNQNQVFEIYALRLGDMEVDSSTVFYQTDFGKRIRKSYYFLCLKSKGHIVLVDTGTSQEELAIRGIFNRPSPKGLLKRINIDTDDVEAIILTHLHSDHFSEAESYPKCVFYVQRTEYQFWSEEIQRFHSILYPPFTRGRPIAGIDALQKLNSLKRVRFLDGDGDVIPGIGYAWCGAHTPGSQLAIVQTNRGKILCCSDFIDNYRNWDERIPVGVLTNLVEWLKGIGKIEQMNLPRESIIPGHDPQLITMFPQVAEDIIKVA
jgi:glyoxylase-like metal-dependent hydrolase (beta-lactamase superfamily II)